MDVAAWCGRCGQQFRLLEVVDTEPAGSCPRCGEPLAPGYVTVLAAAARQLATAAQVLEVNGRQLRDVAPRLHVDTRRLADDLRAELDH